MRTLLTLTSLLLSTALLLVGQGMQLTLLPLRATTNGISALIGADGRLIARGPQFEQVVLA
ncbi:MAG: hypothetical protein ACNA7T_06000, partial [Haliea sp.]